MHISLFSGIIRYFRGVFLYLKNIDKYEICLVHATGYKHLLVNLLLLLLVALPLEMSHGGRRVGAVYFLAWLEKSDFGSTFF